MPLGTNSFTGLLQETHVMYEPHTPLTESEKMQLAISNAVKEAMTEGSVCARTRDATQEHITVAYLDRVRIDDIHTVHDIIVLVEAGQYGGLGVVQLPATSLDLSNLKVAYSDNDDSDDEVPVAPGVIPPFGREAVTWKALFNIAAQGEPTILRRLWQITKDSSVCGGILKPLFESAIRSGKVQIQAVLGGAGEN